MSCTGKKLQGCLGIVATLIAVGTGACSPMQMNGDDVVDVPNAMQQDTFRVDTFRPDTFRPPVDTFVPPVEDTFVPPTEDAVDVVAVDTPDNDVPNAVDVPNFDVPNVDVPNAVDVPNVDVPPGADVPIAPGCGLMVEPAALAVPAVGMSTSVMTSLNAMGMGGTNAATSCQASAGGSERIFRLTLAARTTIEFSTLAANMETDTILEIRRNCASLATSVACNDDDGAGTNSLIRKTLDAGEYFVVLDEYGAAAAATGGAVTLTLRTIAVAPNGTCAGAVPLVVGMPAMGNTQTGGDANPNTCNPGADGPQLYYSYTIPAMTAVTFAATGSGMPAWTPYIRVFNSCATENMCAANGSGMTVVRNATMNPQMVVVSVAAPSPAEGGAYTVSATNVAIPNTAYTVTTDAMASCDDISMSPRDPAIVGDDAASMFSPLPFNVSYFGVNATHWAASTNGMAQLGTAVGPGDVEYINLDLPDMSAPAGGLAVFWDDGNVGAAPQGVRAQVLGAAPSRRFVIEWNHTSLNVVNTLRYQVKLFEGTNIIEYHYCAMSGPMGNTRHTGSSATIGLQSINQMRGQNFAPSDTLNQIGAGAMPVVNMIRWMPNP